MAKQLRTTGAKRRGNGSTWGTKHNRMNKVRCPKCRARLNEDELDDHLRAVHGSLTAKIAENKRLLAYLVFLATVLTVAYFMISAGSPEEEAPLPPPPVNWLETYEPAHTVGSLKDDWWTTYPDIHPESGAPVTHLDWVMDKLEDGPVIILDHSVGCAPCVQQTGDINAVLSAFPGQISYYDLLADGSDKRAYDVFDVYDANGDPPYIPLTVIITRVKDGDSTKIVWHSTEGATGMDWIEGYVKDAIYYHSKS